MSRPAEPARRRSPARDESTSPEGWKVDPLASKNADMARQHGLGSQSYTLIG